MQGDAALLFKTDYKEIRKGSPGMLWLTRGKFLPQLSKSKSFCSRAGYFPGAVV